MVSKRFDELVGLLLDDEISQEQMEELTTLVSKDDELLGELREQLRADDRLSQYEEQLRGGDAFMKSLAMRVDASGDTDDFVGRVVQLADNRSGDTAQSNQGCPSLSYRGQLASSGNRGDGGRLGSNRGDLVSKQ